MFKKTVKFEDFDGNKQEKDFYFHISKAELLGLATSADDMQSRLKRIMEAKDGAGILKELRDLIKLSVGVRSDDGLRFVKDDAAQGTLLESPAYDELLMELATDAEASVNFVKQLIPEKMQKEMAEQLKKNTVVADPFKEPEDNRPAYQKEHRLPTSEEVKAMGKDDLMACWKWREQNNL